MRYNVFSERSFAAIIKPADPNRFRINLSRDRERHLTDAVNEAQSGNPRLAPFKTRVLRDKTYISYERFNDHLALRAVSRHLQNRFRLRIPSREAIVRAVIESLTDNTPLFVIRRDISSFYESIPVCDLEKMILKDTRTSSSVKGYISKYFDQHCRSGPHGLPRGIGLTAILSEIFMTGFDKAIKKIDGVYRYYRFCDDILIISTRNIPDIDDVISDLLPSSMKLNRNKSQNHSVSTKGGFCQSTGLDYLGYNFSLTQPKGKSSRTVRVSINNNKINRIKTKIILSLHRFSRDHNFDLLLKRIKYISGNYIVYRNQSMQKEATHVRSGIFYNYRLCGEYTIKHGSELHFADPFLRELRSLDGFYFSLLGGPSSSFKAHLQRHLTAAQQNKLREISFLKGYQKRMLVRLSPHEVSKIKEVWKHV